MPGEHICAIFLPGASVVPRHQKNKKNKKYCFHQTLTTEAESWLCDKFTTAGLELISWFRHWIISIRSPHKYIAVQMRVCVWDWPPCLSPSSRSSSHLLLRNPKSISQLEWDDLHASCNLPQRSGMGSVCACVFECKMSKSAMGTGRENWHSKKEKKTWLWWHGGIALHTASEFSWATVTKQSCVLHTAAPSKCPNSLSTTHRPRQGSQISSC